MARLRSLQYAAEIYLSTNRTNQIANRAYQIFGYHGTYSLVIMNAYFSSHPLFPALTIDCSGVLRGKFTISELCNLHILSLENTVSHISLVEPIQLESISEAFPHAPFLYVSHLPSVYRKKFVNSKIQTSLPAELQYAYSAALPLGPKTRMAHKYWFEEYINHYENLSLGPSFYQRQLSHEGFISKLAPRFGVKKKLKEIELSIQLTETESQINASWDNMNYYYDSSKRVLSMDHSIVEQVQKLKQNNNPPPCFRSGFENISSENA